MSELDRLTGVGGGPALAAIYLPADERLALYRRVLASIESYMANMRRASDRARAAQFFAPKMSRLRRWIAMLEEGSR
jgi:hypothetical protein